MSSLQKIIGGSCIAIRMQAKDLKLLIVITDKGCWGCKVEHINC